MMGVQWKEIEPFVGLLLTTVALTFVRALLSPRPANDDKGEVPGVGWPKETVQRKRKMVGMAVGGLAAAFVVLGMAMVFAKVPKHLQDTHPAVVALKQQQRDMCQMHMEKFEVAEAEQWIRNNTLSRQLAAEAHAKQRKTIDKALRPAVNQLFFRVGAFLPVLPLFLVIAAEVGILLAGKAVPKRFVPSAADVEFVFMPLFQMITAYTWLVAIGFHFWLRERQVTTCILLSGHWYTFLHTAFAFVASFLWLRMECDPVTGGGPGARRWTGKGSSLPQAFIGWFVVYLALTLRTLATSQQFHHDWQESVEGIKSMLLVMPVAAFGGAYALLYGMEGARTLPKTDTSQRSTESESDAKSTSASTNAGEKTQSLQEAAPAPACPAPGGSALMEESFSGEGANELSVSSGDLVQIISEPENGWVHVLRRDGASGFVPADYVVTSSKPFVLDAAKEQKQGQQQSSKQGQDEKNKGAPTPETAAPTAAAASSKPKEPNKERPSRAVPFLADITKGPKLRHVQAASKKKPSSGADSAGGGGGGGLFAQLKQRLAENRTLLEPEEDEPTSGEWEQ